MANRNHSSNVEVKATAADLTHLKTIQQELSEIDSQALATKMLGEISLDELDAISELIGNSTALGVILRLDALVKAMIRNLDLIRESADLAGAALLSAKGGAA